MSFRIAGCCIGFIAVSVLSALGGPFDSYAGKYKGKGVERNGDGSTYYFNQTVKLEGSSQKLTTTLSGVATAHELIRFRPNGTIAGSGSVTVSGIYITWTVTGTWRQVGDVIKGQNITTYSGGGSTTVHYVHRFIDGKLVMNTSGASDDGTTVTSTYTGKFVETAQ
jgi:hypothetical protein